MRYLTAVLESLLAVAFLATAAVQLVRGKIGATDLAANLILIALGAWLAKLAIANFRDKAASAPEPS